MAWRQTIHTQLGRAMIQMHSSIDENVTAILNCGDVGLKVPLLPAAAKGAIELDEGKGFALLSGCQVELGGEEVGVGGEDLKVGCGSALIAEACQTGCILGGGDQLLLLLAVGALLIQSDKGVGNVAEGSSDGLLVVEDHLLLSFFGEVKMAVKLAALKDWLRERTDAVDGLAGWIEDV